ncbi:MAG: RpiB/LacA/LacB family sugar-phosphate isomerase, partial [Bacteroidota bacterium]
MKIGIATDHGGFDLKQKLQAYLEEKGYEIVDFGAFEYDAADDFPDFVVPLARAVGTGEVDRGVAVCGSG